MTAPARPAILEKLLTLLVPLRAAAEDAEYLRTLLAGVGWDLDQVAGFDADRAAGDLAAAAAHLDALVPFATTPPEGLADYLELLRRAAAVMGAIEDLAAILGTADLPDLPDLDGVGRDLIHALAIGGWYRVAPLSYAIADLLTLVDSPLDGPIAPQRTHGDKIVRRRMPLARVRFDRLSPLLRDPVGHLGATYFPDGLTTTAHAHASADRLFPKLARLATHLGMSGVYGLDPRADFEGTEAERAEVEHALTVIAFPHDAVPFGASFGLSADAGLRGLIVEPFGALRLAHELGAWHVTIEATAQPAAILLGETIDVQGGSGLAMNVVAELLPVFDDRACLGGRGGTGITFGTMRIEGALALGEGARDAAIGIAMDGVRLAIAPGDGDGFLASILPAGGLDATIDLGAGWSSARGFHFRGSASLEAVWPIHRSIGPLALESVRLAIVAGEGGLRASARAAVALRLGPLEVLVDGVGLAADVSFPERGGNLGVAHLGLAFLPPDGLGLALAFGAVRGAGRLRFEPGRYLGSFTLEVADLARVELVGLLETAGAGYSLLLAGSASFPGVPIGFGFELRRAGAVLGVHRRLDTDALVAALQAGRLGGLLVPPPPGTDPSALLAQLGAIFPRAAGAHVGGVVLGIGWGHPTVAAIDVAFLHDTSAPGQLAMIGTIAVRLPEAEPLVELHVDLAGRFAIDPLSIDLRAWLRDSTLAGMALTGDAALQLRLGDAPRFLLSLGGFHSGFTPPADFPVLRRLALALPANDHLALSLEGFFAVTSSSLQFGAHLHVWAGIDGLLGVEGDARFEALLTWRPLHFEADLQVRVAVKVRDTTLFGAELRGTLSGPGPWHVAGGVYISVWGFDVKVYGVDASFGAGSAAPALPPVDLAAEVTAALRAPRNWRALPDGAAGVVLRGDVEAADRILVHPRGALAFTQAIVPLATTIDRVGGARPAGARKVTIGDARLGTASAATPSIDGPFAPGQFLDLDEGEQLAAPAFQQLPAGVRVEPGAGDPAADPTAFAVRATLGYEEVPAPPAPRRRVPDARVVDAALAGGFDGWQAPARPVVVRGPRYVIASTDTLALDAALTPPGGFASRTLALEALRAAAAADPARASLLQLVERAA